VLWQWSGRRLPDDALGTLRSLRAQLDGELGARLSCLLTTRELRRTVRRVDRLLTTKCHPEPSDEWPAVPWPPI
jgi:hypothetical protein